MSQDIKHYKNGIVIGRFQPFHNGHKYLIKKALENVDKLIINIGSDNISNKDNPFTFEQRKKMIEEFIKQEGIEDKILKIVPTDDIPDDDEWVKETTAACGAADVVISNNDSGVNIFFERAGYKVLRFPYFERYILEGVQIRKLIRTGKKWEDRVPKYLVAQIKEIRI